VASNVLPSRIGNRAVITKTADAPAFFRYHGLLAPGVRAFRSIGFPAKSAWVSAAFLMPILLLAWSLWTAASANIEFSAKERVGVDYVRTLMPLLDTAQNRRRAATAGAADLDDAQQKVAQAFRVASEAHARLGGTLQLDEQWSTVRDLQQGLSARATRENASTTFAANTEFIDAVLTLLNDAADKSNLTLDPDVDTFYLMDSALFKQPLLIEQLGQLRGMGNAVIRSGNLSSQQREALGNALAFSKAHYAGVNKAAQRAIKADPSLSQEIRLDEAQATSSHFLGMVRQQVLGDTLQGDPSAFVAAGNAAIKLHYEGVGRVLDALDTRLAARVDSLRRMLWGQLATAAFGIALAVYLLISFYRVTQGGIAEVARQLEEISRGNLRMNPRPWGKDEVARLMHTLAEMLDSLRRVVGQVRASAGEIHTASDEVASASMDLSRRTEESAANLQRTSAAMTQIGATVQQTAQTASGAADLVGRNADVAERGGAVVGQVVNTMGGIRDSSSRIADIIGTIDGIAFQTNILALNAAVEAARAGEQGRGFAVVASEVRSLAQRSSAAAREIKSLIGASVEQVESGAKVVGEAGHTMQQIVENAVQVKVLIGEISNGTSEQTVGLADINRSVAQLDEMTQQNAALVEQTAAAAASLKDNAQKLNKEMEFFKIG